jgi:hypothetical protein
MDVREAFGADVELRGPDPRERGYFLLRRRPAVDHERFVRLVSARVGGDAFVLLDSPGGIVVVNTPFGVARALEGLPEVAHVGGVTVDLGRLEAAFSDPLGPWEPTDENAGP